MGKKVVGTRLGRSDGVDDGRSDGTSDGWTDTDGS